ncbi:MAG: Photosystem I assembly protein Ycf3 [Catillopecten margaritatus gill symbiont]|uniref:Photosystem I assembly protein Ycf3 n=1 Tax=Catillopecten margaritatus gill symbiont TaxID=3083288 RepID=A0AAU6PI78_9GAMM
MQYQEAIDAYKKAIEIKPDEDRAYNNMGIAYGKLGQYQEAIDAYKKAIEIKPDKDEAYYNMGIAHDKLGQHQEAIDAYKKAIEIKPDEDEAYTNLFELRLTQGQEFDQKLINSFKENCKNNQGAMMKFNMLNIFKTIDASHAPDNWQNEFKNKHQGVTFEVFLGRKLENGLILNLINKHYKRHSLFSRLLINDCFTKNSKFCASFWTVNTVAKKRVN